MRLRHVATAALAAMTPTYTASADVVTLGASADTSIYSHSPDLSNGAGDYLFVGRTYSRHNKRALLRFDIASAIPPGSTITDVSLKVYTSRARTEDTNVGLHRLTADWGEGASHAPAEEGGGATAQANDATWDYRFYNPSNPTASTAWTTPGGDFVATPSQTAIVPLFNADVTWTSTPELVADVQTWLDAPAENFGWILIGDEDNFSAKRLNSRVNQSTPTRPLLSVTFTPTTVVDTCPCEFNDDPTTVDITDLVAFLDIWLEQQSTRVEPGAGADYDESGVVDIADLLAYLDCWFDARSLVPCP